MKRIIIPAVFKAVCCFLILILLTIGFQYIIWLRFEPHYYMIEKALIVPAHFTPDLWPFDRPIYSGW